MTTYNHTAIENGDSRGNDAEIWNDPLGTLDAAIGNLSALTTTQKTSLAAALNEVAAARLSGDTALDDRIDTLGVEAGNANTEVTAARTAINYLTGSAPASLGDTMQYASADIYNVLAYGAVADATTDNSTAFQAAIDDMPVAGGVLYIPRASAAYLVNDEIDLASNVHVVSDGATLLAGSGIFDRTGGTTPQAFFKGTGVSNVRVSGLVFDGNGEWTDTPFAHPDGGGNAVGYTNFVTGVFVQSSSSQILIDHCRFLNSGYAGVWASVCTDMQINNCQFDNMGRACIRMAGCRRVNISNCIFTNVYGNTTEPGVTDPATGGGWADGIYMYAQSETTITGCYFENMRRIGVVLEGDASTLTDRITITGNTFYSITGASDRGAGEYNAGVWVEDTKAGYQVTISGNTFDAIETYGIYAQRATITGNTIANVDDVTFAAGIAAWEAHIEGNLIHSCVYGIIVSGTQTSAQQTTIKSNTIRNCLRNGLYCEEVEGVVTVTGNTFHDNGQGTGLDAYRLSGIYARDLVSTFKLIINGNTFISSADQGDTAGQLYGIVFYPDTGGTFNSGLITNNTFLFTGTFTTTTQPGKLNVAPASLVQYNGSTYLIREMGTGVSGNVNTKYSYQPADIAVPGTLGGQIETYQVAVTSSGSPQNIDTSVRVGNNASRIVIVSYRRTSTNAVDTHIILHNSDGDGGSDTSVDISEDLNGAGTTSGLALSAVSSAAFWYIRVTDTFSQDGTLTVTAIG